LLFAAAKKKELKTIDDGRTKESSPTARKGVEASAPCVFLFPSPSGPSKAAYACGSRASGLKCAWNELKTAARRPKARAAWVPLARERRCCSGVRRRRRPLRRASKGIGCPRPQRRRRRNGGAPSPFLPLVALLTLRACRARRGGGVPQRGGSSERRRWSERGRSCIPLAAVFFPPLGVDGGKAAEQRQRGDSNQLVPALSLALSTNNAPITGRSGCCWKDDHPLQAQARVRERRGRKEREERAAIISPYLITFRSIAPLELTFFSSCAKTLTHTLLSSSSLSTPALPIAVSNREIVTTIPTIGEFKQHSRRRANQRGKKRLFIRRCLFFLFVFLDLLLALTHFLFLSHSRTSSSSRFLSSPCRLQRRDRRVQEHLVHRVGRGRPGQGARRGFWGKKREGGEREDKAPLPSFLPPCAPLLSTEKPPVLGPLNRRKERRRRRRPLSFALAFFP